MDREEFDRQFDSYFGIEKKQPKGLLGYKPGTKPALDRETFDKQFDAALGELPKEAKKEKRGFLGRVKESWDIGSAMTDLGQLRYRQLLGEDTPELHQAIQKQKTIMHQYRTPPKYGLPEKAVRAAAEMLPIQVAGLTKGITRGLTTGMGFAGITAAAGQLGPQAALPEEIITVPAAFTAGYGVGMLSGTLENIGQIEAGLAYEELLELKDKQGNRLNPTIAKGAAASVGIINGLLEMAQIKLLLKTIPGGESLLRGTIRDVVTKAATNKTLKNIALKYGTKYGQFVTAETGQEIAQETTNILANEAAKKLNNKLKKSDIPYTTRKEITDRLLETAEQSALAFSVMGIPGHVAGGAIETARPSVAEMEAEERISDIEEIKTKEMPEPELDIKNTRLASIKTDLARGRDARGNPFGIDQLIELKELPEIQEMGLDDEINKLIIDAYQTPRREMPTRLPTEMGRRLEEREAAEKAIREREKIPVRFEEKRAEIPVEERIPITEIPGGWEERIIPPEKEEVPEKKIPITIEEREEKVPVRPSELAKKEEIKPKEIAEVIKKEKPVLKGKITNNDVYELVNSIKPVPFDTKGTSISFKFITDSRFLPENKVKSELETMIEGFETKAKKLGLDYRISNFRKVTFGEPEPGFQYRVNINITKPSYQKEITKEKPALKEKPEIKKPYKGLTPGTEEWKTVWREHPELQNEMLKYREGLKAAPEEKIIPKTYEEYIATEYEGKKLSPAMEARARAEWEVLQKGIKPEKEIAKPKIEVKPIPKELEPLAEEARKYKSAEEFDKWWITRSIEQRDAAYKAWRKLFPKETDENLFSSTNIWAWAHGYKKRFYEKGNKIIREIVPNIIKSSEDKTLLTKYMDFVHKKYPDTKWDLSIGKQAISIPGRISMPKELPADLWLPYDKTIMPEIKKLINAHGSKEIASGYDMFHEFFHRLNPRGTEKEADRFALEHLKSFWQQATGEVGEAVKKEVKSLIPQKTPWEMKDKSEFLDTFTIEAKTRTEVKEIAKTLNRDYGDYFKIEENRIVPKANAWDKFAIEKEGIKPSKPSITTQIKDLETKLKAKGFDVARAKDEATKAGLVPDVYLKKLEEAAGKLKEVKPETKLPLKKEVKAICKGKEYSIPKGYELKENRGYNEKLGRYLWKPEKGDYVYSPETGEIWKYLEWQAMPKGGGWALPDGYARLQNIKTKETDWFNNLEVREAILLKKKSEVKPIAPEAKLPIFKTFRDFVESKGLKWPVSKEHPEYPRLFKEYQAVKEKVPKITEPKIRFFSIKTPTKITDVEGKKVILPVGEEYRAIPVEKNIVKLTDGKTIEVKVSQINELEKFEIKEPGAVKAGGMVKPPPSEWAREYLKETLGREPKSAEIKTELVRAIGDEISVKEILIPEEERVVLRGARKGYEIGRKVGKAEIKERQKTAAETAKARKTLRENIKKMITDLKAIDIETLSKGPAETVRNLLEGIDLVKRKKSTMLRLANTRKYLMEHPEKTDMPDYVMKDLEKLDERNLNDITYNELESIHKAVMQAAAIDKSIKRIKAHRKVRKEKEVKDAILKELKSPQKITREIINSQKVKAKGFKRAGKRMKEVFNRFLHYDLLIQQIAGRGSLIEDILGIQLFDGRDEVIKYEGKISKKFANDIKKLLPKDIDITKWLDETVTIGKFTLTRNERMSLYRDWLNEDNRKSKIKGGFGFPFSDTPDRIYRITEEEFKAIVDSLTSEEKAISDLAVPLYDIMYEDINKIFYEKNWHDLSKESMYWRKHTMPVARGMEAEEEIALDKFKGKWVRIGIPRGRLIKRKRVYKPTYLYPFTRQIFEDVKWASTYIGLELPLTNASKILYDKQIKAAIRTRYGPEYWKELEKGVRDIAGEFKTYTNIEKGFMKTKNRVTTAALGISFAIPKQTVSWLWYLPYIDLGHMVQGTLDYIWYKKDIENRHRLYSPKYDLRLEGGYSRDIADLFKSGAEKKFYGGRKGISEWIMGGIKFFDKIAVTCGMQAATRKALSEIKEGKLSYEVKKALNITDKDIKNLDAAEQMKLAYRFADYVTVRTQPMFSPEHRSSLSRGTVAEQIFTMFGTATNTGMNMVIRAFEEAKAEKNPQAYQKLAKSLVILFIVTPLAITAIDRLRDKITKKKKIRSWKRGIADSIGGYFYFLRDLISPVTYALDTGTYWGVNFSLPMERIPELAIDTTKFGLKALAEKDRKAAKKFVDSAFNLGFMLAGIPYETPRSIIKGQLKKKKGFKVRVPKKPKRPKTYSSTSTGLLDYGL